MPSPLGPLFVEEQHRNPFHVMFVDGWPMTVSGKVQKYKMRETSIETLGLENAAKIVTA